MTRRRESKIRRLRHVGMLVVAIPAMACGSAAPTSVPPGGTPPSGTSVAVAGGTRVVIPGVVPTPTPPLLVSPSEITLADNRGTARITVGAMFGVRLTDPPPFAGSMYATWRIAVDDSGILDEVPNAVAPPGTQGVYRAIRPGTTTLRASTHYPCYDVKPPCDIPQRDFQLTVQVEPRP